MVAYRVNNTAPPSTAITICFNNIYEYLVVLPAVLVSIMFALSIYQKTSLAEMFFLQSAILPRVTGGGGGYVKDLS